MTNGLAKERMTYFYSKTIAYQAFNTIFGTAKVFVYVLIDGGKYILCSDFEIDHKIANEHELKLIAIENERAWN